MSGPAIGGAGATRGHDRRRVRWPVLSVALLLLVLLGLTTTLERTAPQVTGSVPAVAPLLPPVLETPVRCSRADSEERLDRLRATLEPEGRLTAAVATACPRLLDGREVVYVGEIVGDVLRRDGGAWVQVNDDPYALEVGPFGPHRNRLGFSTGLAVWLPDGLHEQLGEPGRHGNRGAIVRVEGMLLRADPGDGGGLNVRAEQLEVLAPAAPVDEPLNRPLILSAAIAALLASITWAWARRTARSRER
jgi:hypothetical protein